MSTASAPGHALVLSGGGARGAYEAGVLNFVYGEKLLPPPRGVFATSVGAVNGAHCASNIDDLRAGTSELCSLWTDLEIDNVLSFGLMQIVKIRSLVMNSDEPSSLFDVRPLTEMVRKQISWTDLEASIHNGSLDLFTVATTELETGRATLFVHGQEKLREEARLHELMNVRRCTVTPAHVLASASIPLVFPPVEIDECHYCDGGLRLNTPIAPALHFGYDKIFVIGVSASQMAREANPMKSPGLMYVLGKVLNAFLLDNLLTDLHTLERFNHLYDTGQAAFGSEFGRRMQQAGPEHAIRKIDTLVIHPSRDLGMVAADYLKQYRFRLRDLFGSGFMKLLERSSGNDADLASYLLFHGGYAQRLIELGFRDAQRRRFEIEAQVESWF